MKTANSEVILITTYDKDSVFGITDAFCSLKNVSLLEVRNLDTGPASALGTPGGRGLCLMHLFILCSALSTGHRWRLMDESIRRVDSTHRDPGACLPSSYTE